MDNICLCLVFCLVISFVQLAWDTQLTSVSRYGLFSSYTLFQLSVLNQLTIQILTKLSDVNCHCGHERKVKCMIMIASATFIGKDVEVALKFGKILYVKSFILLQNKHTVNMTIFKFLYSPFLEIDFFELLFLSTPWSRKIETVKIGCIYSSGRIEFKISVFKIDLIILLQK